MSRQETVRFGDGIVTVFGVGKLSMKRSEVVRKGTELPQGVSIDAQVEFPIYNALVKLDNASVLVDPCDYEVLAPVGEPWRPKGYVPPPSLLTQLAEAGVNSEDVTHVVITHFHLDHCIGSTRKGADGRYHPAFPRARYYLGTADWDYPQVQDEIKSNPQATNSLGVLHESKVLTLIDRSTDVAPGVEILPAPGESPGHQMLKMVSNGDTFYSIGDLFHEPMEAADPRIMAEWSNPEANMKSRVSFLADSAREDATAFAGHMSLGKIRKTATGYEWKDLREQ